jgi:hypothetical protein
MDIIDGGTRAWTSITPNGSLHRYSEKRGTFRMGHGVQPPGEGAVCLCIGHSGDGFHSYLVLKQGTDGFWRASDRFGAYGLGEHIGYLEPREFYLLLAGEPVQLPGMDGACFAEAQKTWRVFNTGKNIPA